MTIEEAWALRAEDAFDTACGHVLHNARAYFAKRYARYFSDETDESLRRKASLVRDMQRQGMSWSEATDHPDVYLGREDRRYVVYLQNHSATFTSQPLSLDEYRRNLLVGYAIDDVRRAITEGGLQ